MRIAILAKGPSLQRFEPQHDEVWGLNQLGKSHDLDLLFVMDDLRMRLPGWDPDLPEWLKTYDRRIMTSKVYPEWPTAEEFPIQEVCRAHGWPQGISFHGSVDYMLAYGIHIGAKRMDLYGVDCINPKREERTRVSIAMWIGIAQSRGIHVTTQPGGFFQWFTQPGVCWEQGMYGYSAPPRMEVLYGEGKVRDGLEEPKISRCV